MTNQLGALPRHEVQVPRGEVNEESEANARCSRPAVLLPLCEAGVWERLMR